MIPESVYVNLGASALFIGVGVVAYLFFKGLAYLTHGFGTTITTNNYHTNNSTEASETPDSPPK